MFQEVLVADRTISGQGLVRLPIDVTKQKYLSVTVDVLRRPTIIHESYKYSPRRQRYCTLCFVRNKYVIEEKPCDYEKRQFFFIADITSQTLLAVKCAYEGTLQTFFNLGNALSLPSISVTNLIKDFSYLSFYWDEIQVVCEADTAVQVRIFAKKLDSCNEDNNKDDTPPPPPPPKPTSTPGQGRQDVDQPYDSDDKVTKPNAIDNTPPRDNRTPKGSGYCSTSYDVAASAVTSQGADARLFANVMGPIQGWDAPILVQRRETFTIWRFILRGAPGVVLVDFNLNSDLVFQPYTTLSVTRRDGKADNCPDPFA